MTRPAPHERPPTSQSKTLAQYAEAAQREEGRDGVTIAGKPADKCPYCGCAMFATGTRQGEGVTFRYVHCRNAKCGKRFYSKQPKHPPATIVRELGDDDLSSNAGQPHLTLIRESA